MEYFCVASTSPPRRPATLVSSLWTSNVLRLSSTSSKRRLRTTNRFVLLPHLNLQCDVLYLRVVPYDLPVLGLVVRVHYCLLNLLCVLILTENKI